MPTETTTVRQRDALTARHLEDANADIERALRAMPNDTASEYTANDAKTLNEIQRELTILRTAAMPAAPLPPAFPIDSHQLRCLYDWASHDHDAASIQVESLADGTLRATQGDDSIDIERGDV